MQEIKESLARYIEHRIPCGGFLMAVLRNDLVDACGRADSINKHRIYDIVAYCYNSIPGISWGSPEKVNSWLKNEDNIKNDNDDNEE